MDIFDSMAQPSVLDFIKVLNSFSGSGRLNHYDLLLKHGITCTPKPKPGKVKWGALRTCFQNAFELASAHHDLIYTEGFGVPSGLFPMHHAWCITNEGEVIDNTWRGPGTEYFGIPFKHNFVAESIARSGFYSLLFNFPATGILECHPSEFVMEMQLTALKK